MTNKAELMKLYQFHNNAANELRVLANDCRLLEMFAEMEDLYVTAAPHRELADQYYHWYMNFEQISEAALTAVG